MDELASFQLTANQAFNTVWQSTIGNKIIELDAGAIETIYAIGDRFKFLSLIGSKTFP